MIDYRSICSEQLFCLVKYFCGLLFRGSEKTSAPLGRPYTLCQFVLDLQPLELMTSQKFFLVDKCSIFYFWNKLISVWSSVSLLKGHPLFILLFIFSCPRLSQEGFFSSLVLTLRGFFLIFHPILFCLHFLFALLFVLPCFLSSSSNFSV